jgi:hypothetical protein
MEQVFIKRAIELIKEAQDLKEIPEIKKKLGQIEGYMTGALEMFALAEKQTEKIE